MLKYGMFVKPIGYLIDEQGIVVRDVAVGVEPILALADEPVQDRDDRPQVSLNGNRLPLTPDL